MTTRSFRTRTSQHCAQRLRRSAKIKTFVAIAGTAVVALHSAPALAASFDCTKAHTAREKNVCSDPAISDLDGNLGRL